MLKLSHISRRSDTPTTETTIIEFPTPEDGVDYLTQVLRDGARRLLAQAVEAEAAAFLARYAEDTTEDGHRRVVRHGHQPERVIQTGIGPVPVKKPRLRDRGGADGAEPVRFTSEILVPRRAPGICAGRKLWMS